MVHMVCHTNRLGLNIRSSNGSDYRRDSVVRVRRRALP